MMPVLLESDIILYRIFEKSDSKENNGGSSVVAKSQINFRRTQNSSWRMSPINVNMYRIMCLNKKGQMEIDKSEDREFRMKV